MLSHQPSIRSVAVRPCRMLLMAARTSATVVVGPGRQRSRQQGALRMNHHPVSTPVFCACRRWGPSRVAAICSAMSQSASSAGCMPMSAAAWCSGVPERTARTPAAVSCRAVRSCMWRVLFSAEDWRVDQEAGVPPADRFGGGMGGGVQGKGEAGVAFEEPCAVCVSRAAVPDKQIREVWQGVCDGRCAGLTSRAPGGLVEPGPAVAEAGVGDAGELGRVGKTVGEGVFGYVLAGGVGGGEGGQLLGAGDAGGSVAPAGPKLTGMA